MQLQLGALLVEHQRHLSLAPVRVHRIILRFTPEYTEAANGISVITVNDKEAARGATPVTMVLLRKSRVCQPPGTPVPLPLLLRYLSPYKTNLPYIDCTYRAYK
eukprot:5481254-Pyramimonas_sp.AAC.1